MDNEIIELDRENIQAVVDASLNQTVVMSFYAPSHPESVDLSDSLERLCANRCILAKVNCETQMEIAAYFRVQSLPTVLLLKDGQPVDGFAGKKSDDELSRFLAPYLAPAWAKPLAEAKALLAEGQVTEALTLLKTLEPDAEEAGAAWMLAMADAELLLGDIGSAELRLSAIGLADQDAYFNSLKARLALAKEAADTPQIRELQSRFDAAPEDHRLRIELARALAQARREEEALALLFEVLSRDLQAEQGGMKSTFMEIITAMGQGNAIANQFRRKLYGLLY